ncbi:MAG TPA: PhzF family phenazine biosynthesis protein [Longimicrobium sp.]|nr:PhzF family phenazine biosynthesis protein [Longimicrobium sp.]
MPTELPFHTLDVFTDRAFGGNPLAVFPDAEGLDAERMQAIAGEMNLSETTFVLPPTDPACTHRVRIFTPRAELPFAGHPTLGTACLLASLGRGGPRLVLEEAVGPVPVEVRTAPGQAPYAELTSPRLPERGAAVPDADALAVVLSLEAADLVADFGPAAAYSAGVPFLFVPVRDRSALARARLDRAAWEAQVAGGWAPQVFPFCLEPARDVVHAYGRMFAPALGIPEDPATGGVAAAFAGWLADHAGAPDGDGTLRCDLRQGVEMGRPSLLHVYADFRAGRLSAVRVGGHAVRMCDGVLRLNDDGGER